MSTGSPISDELRPIVSASHWLLTGLTVQEVTERIGRSFAYLGPAGAAAVVQAAQLAQAAGAAWHAAGPLATLGQAVPAAGFQPEALVDVRLSFVIGTGNNARRQYVTYRDYVQTGQTLDDVIAEMTAVAEAFAGEYGSDGRDIQVEIVGVF